MDQYILNILEEIAPGTGWQCEHYGNRVDFILDYYCDFEHSYYILYRFFNDYTECSCNTNLHHGSVEKVPLGSHEEFKQFLRQEFEWAMRDYQLSTSKTDRFNE